MLTTGLLSKNFALPAKIFVFHLSKGQLSNSNENSFIYSIVEESGGVFAFRLEHLHPPSHSVQTFKYYQITRMMQSRYESTCSKNNKQFEYHKRHVCRRKSGKHKCKLKRRGVTAQPICAGAKGRAPGATNLCRQHCM